MITDTDQLERIVAEGRRLTVLAEMLRLDASDACTDGEAPATVLAMFAPATSPSASSATKPWSR